MAYLNNISYSDTAYYFREPAPFTTILSQSIDTSDTNGNVTTVKTGRWKEVLLKFNVSSTTTLISGFTIGFSDGTSYTRSFNVGVTSALRYVFHWKKTGTNLATFEETHSSSYLYNYHMPSRDVISDGIYCNRISVTVNVAQAVFMEYGVVENAAEDSPDASPT